MPLIGCGRADAEVDFINASSLRGGCFESPAGFSACLYFAITQATNVGVGERLVSARWILICYACHWAYGGTRNNCWNCSWKCSKLQPHGLRNRPRSVKKVLVDSFMSTDFLKICKNNSLIVALRSSSEDDCCYTDGIFLFKRASGRS
jgi:hypothetical protein